VDVIALAAWSAAILQALAYTLYARGTLRRTIRPNPTSWLMWAYGTALVVVLESEQGIHPGLRLLPIVCASCSILIAALCWRRGSLGWPSDRFDRLLLGLDIGLTVAWVAISAAAFANALPARLADVAGVVLLVSVCVSNVVSYVPILRSTRANPQHEDWLPWAIWTVAYATLLGATFAAEGSSPAALQFWIYPATCVVLSAIVGSFARRPVPASATSFPFSSYRARKPRRAPQPALMHLPPA
jgi:hypothetical protein